MRGEEQAQQLPTKAGGTQITIHRLPHDIQNSYFVSGLHLFSFADTTPHTLDISLVDLFSASLVP